MKRTIGIVTMAAAMTVGVYLCSRVWAQGQTGAQPARQPSSPSTRARIGIINLGQVMKNYSKFKNFEAELKQEGETIQKNIDQKKQKIAEYEKVLPNVQNDTNRREQYERAIKQLQREIQDLTEDARQKLGKKEYDQVVATYKEIKEVVEWYARRYDLELVLHYTDGVEADAYSPMIFSRKLGNGACWPMYWAQGIDITVPVYTALNQRLTSASPAPGSANGRTQ